MYIPVKIFLILLATQQAFARITPFPNENRYRSLSAVKTVTLKGAFKMKRGEIVSPTVAYETWGTLSSDASNCIFIFTGLSPSAHACSSKEDPSTGWWEDMVGPNKPIDTNEFFVICMNSLGSCFGSTGPFSVNPETNTPYRLSFPVLSVEDIANAASELLNVLKIDLLHTVVGPSMGGMSALSFCLQHPHRVKRLISISSATRSSPFSIALRSLQREIIRNDPNWEEGNYNLDGNGPISGMRLARKLGMITYRSAAEWSNRFGRERAQDKDLKGGAFGIDFEIESYLESHASKFIGTFDPNCYLYLSRAMDLFDASDPDGNLENSLRKLDLDQVLVIGVKTDLLFPINQQEELASALEKHVAGVQLVKLDSIQGHDSFLVDMDRFRPVISSFI